MGGSLADAAFAAALASCTRLEEIDLTAGERALGGARGRGAITQLPALRRLRLAISSDVPTALATRELAPWLSSMRQLETLDVGLEGPGAQDAAAALSTRLAAALPGTEVALLRPALL